MAKMYPKEFSKDTKSNAEKLLFEQFSEQLPDDFIVMHGVGCLIRDPKNHDLDKEIDFLIIHPKRGLLVLEVKGGRIEVEGGRWYSIDRFDKKHELSRSPFEQAKHNLYALRDKIAEAPSTQPFQGDYRWHRGVALPSVKVGREGFGTEASRDIIIDSTDLHSLELAIRRIMGSSGQKDPLPSNAIRALVDLLKPTRKIGRAGLGYQVLSARDEIIELTEQQYKVLDTLQLQRRALISGCAGSGKTMLAMEKARRLAMEGFRVLFTCYNVSLGDWVREHFGRDPNPLIRKIHVAHYNKLAHDFCSRAGVLADPDSFEDLDQYFSEVMPERLFDALAIIPDRFDAIVADEGQDISEKWWEVLPYLLSDPDHGIFYIFYDDNQRIYQRENKFPFQEPVYPLTINCRNTDRIHRRVVQYHRGSPKPRSSGLDGPEPEIVPVENGNRVEALRNVFTRLFTEERIPADRVVILTPRSGTSDFKRVTKIGTKTLTWNKRPGANEVRVCSIHSFKGLESPVVILAELDRFHPDSPRDELLYVATSRAQSHLIVLGELPEPTTLPPPGQTESDLDGAERISVDIVVESAIAADPVTPPTADDVITPVDAPNVAVEPAALSAAIELASPSSSDVIAVPVAPMEADTAISVAATATGVPEAGSSSTEPRLSPPSPRIGRAPVRRRRVAVRVESRPSPPSPRIGIGGQGVRADGNDDRIPAPLALPAPTPTNAAPSVQEPADRVVPVRHQTPPPPPPGAPRPSWTSQADDPRQWSGPPVERVQPRTSTRPPTSTPPSSGVAGAAKSPKTEGGRSATVDSSRKANSPHAEPPGNGWAVAALLCGILALFIHILAIAAIIAAAVGLSKTRERGGRGKAAGWIGLALGVIVVLQMLQ
ncbi:NERD domain-containing protein [Nitrolancea hollandica]|uniref:DNA 3'-5' helicase II n=1 Tax=Nitrolancea hollandica Lb TaxID=1129897 RepID=I4EIK2_9BACT|nr:NERD domain-containing protein [Nitrolancea hollandica]CCF84514.1 hypothetical protein NITHO_3510019 [Nitrolancea hollandica Lb]